MIKLAQNNLMFMDENGESFPLSAEAVSVEIMGKTESPFDAEFVKHAAAAVLHYYRDELGRDTVTVAEFTLALEKILRGFGVVAKDEPAQQKMSRIARSDLRQLVEDSASVGELLFFPKLRTELKSQLDQNPELLCFQGLRDCVKRLSGSSRWTPRCQNLHDQIIAYLRNCMTQDGQGNPCALMVS